MLGTITLLGHALAALLFAVVALSQARRAATALPRLAFVLALGFTALSALAVAGIGSLDPVARIAESLRDMAWLGFMFALVRRDHHGTQATAVALIYGVVAVIVVAGTTLDVVLTTTGSASASGIASAAWVLRMMVAVSALVLVHHLYSAVTPRARGGIRLVVAGLALMWGVDLTLYAAAYLSGTWPAELVALLYRRRWVIELFFRWLKCLMKCRHFLCESERGVTLQLYLALIGAVLVALWTGKRPNKRQIEALQFYFLGWATLDELMSLLNPPPPKKKKKVSLFTIGDSFIFY